MKVRIRIREQLCLLISLTSLVALMILALSTWFQTIHYLRQARAEKLSVTANLKATQTAETLSLFRDSVYAFTTRDILQGSVRAYNRGNRSSQLVEIIQSNLENALSAGDDDAVFLQGMVFPRLIDTTGKQQAIANATSRNAIDKILLPYTTDNGTRIYLGDNVNGFPPSLYPNFTVGALSPNVTYYDGKPLSQTSTLLLGPLFLRTNSSLISMTVPINNNTSRSDVLGYLTLVLDAKILYNILGSRVGFGYSGEVVLVGPTRPDNLFANPVGGRSESENADVPLQFILPPTSNRHSLRTADPYLPFPMKQYPPAIAAWSKENDEINNAGALMSTHNEQGFHIACGYARVPTDIVNWALVFGQSYSEVVAPMNRLRNTVIACIFSVVGAIMIFCFPMAHFAVKPIAALKMATERSVATYEAYVPSEKSDSDTEKTLLSEEKGIRSTMRRKAEKSRPLHKVRTFRIPERVPQRHHLVQDELTDLTSTFNDMADELSIQYAKLEERVRTRTAELEQSRNAANAANDSKTLFIANVSHELRTPLNGIIGMCAVAMQEEDVARIRQSLNIIYKSSDLLLHLLNDLLTFSRSSFGQQLAIEEGTFRLVDIGTQLVSIFEKQARDAGVNLRVVFLGANSHDSEDDQDRTEDAIVARKDATGDLRRIPSHALVRAPGGIGPLRNMSLRGDKNRILQVLMNLVSNALKFTPARGTVEIRIRCKGLAGQPVGHDTTTHKEAAVFSKETAQTIGVEVNPQDLLRKPLMFEFEVEDTGTGIPEHLQEEIFKPFVQGDLALNKKHGGTGLGLAICAQLAELMGGMIALRSTVDIGSTFTLSLPLRYTKEVVPSIAGSLARQSTSKAPSLSNSIPVETMSARARMIRDVHSTPRSTKTSSHSQERDLTRPLTPSQSQYFPAHTSPENTENSTCWSQQHDNKRPHVSRLETIQTIATPMELHEPSSTEPALASPLEEFDENKKLKPAASRAQNRDLHILVAEDNSVNQQVILRLLALEKVASVTLAEDGEQAFHKVEESCSDENARPFSLILMDIQMPKMDGLESTKRIRALGFEGPIVALTAFDHETNRAACYEAGMNGFLPKPIRRTALKKILEDYRPSAEGPATNGV